MMTYIFILVLVLLVDVSVYPMFTLIVTEASRIVIVMARNPAISSSLT